MKLILASGSEWRARMMKWLNQDFEVKVSGFDENLIKCEDPEELVVGLATAKARTVVKHLKTVELDEGRYLVIGADTVVLLDGEVIGKPKDRLDAKKIIGKLQGRTHVVMTGVCVMDVDSGDMLVETDSTKVTFSKMSEKQMEEYLDIGEWQGKAGGYQTLKSIDKYLEKLDGSVTNVIGLPMGKLTEMLEEMGLRVEVDVRQVIEKETGYGS